MAGRDPPVLVLIWDGDRHLTEWMGTGTWRSQSP